MLIFFIAILIFLIKYLDSLRFFLIFQIFMIIELSKYVLTINFLSDSILCLRFLFFEFFVSKLTMLNFNNLIISLFNWFNFNIICFWYSVFLLSVLFENFEIDKSICRILRFVFLIWFWFGNWTLIKIQFIKFVCDWALLWSWNILDFDDLTIL